MTTSEKERAFDELLSGEARRSLARSLGDELAEMDEREHEQEFERVLEEDGRHYVLSDDPERDGALYVEAMPWEVGA